MQYSLRTIMLAILALALLLVLPGPILWLAWMLLPTVLVGVWRYGSPVQQSFALGSLLGYLALALQEGGPRLSPWFELIARGSVIGFSGGMMVWLQRWWAGPDAIAEPPPWPEE